MYLEFLGFERPPFNLTPDSRFLFLSQRHREALASLEYGITSRKGFIVLTGDIGAGKTTLCRSLLHRLSPETKVALILNSYLSDVEILQAINDELGVTCPHPGSRKALIDALNRFLLIECAAGNDVLVIIDEAQNLAPSTLEQVRMLSNLETENDKLLQILLMGQPELRDTLRLPELQQLNQRITVRYHLGPLERDEVATYLNHRMAVAGPENRVYFEPAAIERLHRFAGGVPRKMNLVADRSLLAAYAANSTHVTPALVERAIEEVAGELEAETPPAPRPRNSVTAPASLQAGDAAQQATLGNGQFGQGVAAGLALATGTHGAPGWVGGQAIWPQQPGMLMPPTGYIPAAAWPQQPVASPHPAPEPAPVPIPPQAPRRSMAVGMVAGLGVALLALLLLMLVGGVAAAMMRPDLLEHAAATLRGTSALAPAPVAQHPTPHAVAVAQPPAARPDVTPSPTPRPTPTPAPTPVPWSIDPNDIIRVSEPAHMALAVELTLARRQFGVKLNTDRLASLSPAMLAKTTIGDLPELKSRGIARATLSTSVEDLFLLGQPALVRVAPPAGGSLSAVLFYPGGAPQGDRITLGDPRHGLLPLPVSLLKQIFREADLFFFDEEGIAGLAQGDNTPKAASLQLMLRRAGVWNDNDQPDGRFGLATRSAIQKFQRETGIDDSGEPNALTVMLLQLAAAGRRIEFEAVADKQLPEATPADAVTEGDLLTATDPSVPVLLP